MLEKLKPGMAKKWLFLTAGLTWIGVGIYLCCLAYGWLIPPTPVVTVILTLCGLGLAAVIGIFGFSRLSRKNVKRIHGLESEKPCLFAFQKWSSYPLILVMIGLGKLLRLSPLPKPYLAVLYIGIGGGLIWASLLYYRVLFPTAKD